MSIDQIIVLAAIVGAFVLFAAVLGWVDYRGRVRDRKEAALTVVAFKKDDKSAAAASGTGKARWPELSDDRRQHVA